MQQEDIMFRTFFVATLEIGLGIAPQQPHKNSRF
jgi:hypothetical protein